MVYLICVIFENFKARRSTKHGEYLLKKSFNTKLFKFIRNLPRNQQPLQVFRKIKKIWTYLVYSKKSGQK